jgi:hypothetical protein
MNARIRTDVIEAVNLVNPESGIAFFLRNAAQGQALEARVRQDRRHAYIAPTVDSDASLEFGRTYLRCAVDPSTAGRFAAEHPGMFRVHVSNGLSRSLEVSAAQLRDPATMSVVTELFDLANTHRMNHVGRQPDPAAPRNVRGNQRRVGAICPVHHMKRDLVGNCPDCER